MTVSPLPDNTDSGVSVCYRHPQVETGLRCNRCNKPICPKCARRTPVGFRCPECIREQENKYYSGGNMDYVVAAAVSFPLSLIAMGLFSLILSSMFWGIIITVIAGPVAAGFIAEAVRWAVRKRRSRYLGHVTAAGLIVSALPFLLIFLLLGMYFQLIVPGIFVVVGVTTILARLR